VQVGISQVLKLLRKELLEDQISSHLLFIDGSQRDIPDHFWSGVPAMGVLRSGAIDRSTAAIINRSVSLNAPALRADGMLTAQNPLADAVVGYLFFLDIDIEAVGGDPASKAKRSSAKAESDCRKWLTKLIKDSPQDVIYTNDQLLTEAQSMFPGLSIRAFDRSKAIAAENFPAWTKQGRRSIKRNTARI